MQNDTKSSNPSGRPTNCFENFLRQYLEALFIFAVSITVTKISHLVLSKKAISRFGVDEPGYIFIGLPTGFQQTRKTTINRNQLAQSIMQKRPKIKIHLTPTDKLVEILGWLALISLWVLTATNYSKLPDTIPVHFNGAGKADGYGEKSTIFMLPSLATLVFVGMTIVNRFPHIFNYLIEITASNALRQYTIATKMIRYLKTIIVLVFSSMTFKTIQSATGQSEGLGAWFLPLTLGLIFIPVIYFIFKSLKTEP